MDWLPYGRSKMSINESGREYIALGDTEGCAGLFTDKPIIRVNLYLIIQLIGNFYIFITKLGDITFRYTYYLTTMRFHLLPSLLYSFLERAEGLSTV